MIKITTESTSDLERLLEKEEIAMQPLFVELDGVTHLDGEDIRAEDIFNKYEEKKILPKTAARGIDDYVKFFTRVKEESGADQLIHISISSELSASCSNATLAAKEVEGVYVVDSRSLSTGVGLLVLKANDLAREGKSAEEIVEIINGLTPYVQASFVVDTMEYLHKGGRCSSLTRLIAGILKIKPMLILNEGKITVGQKFMGNLEKSVKKYVEAVLKQYDNPDYGRIFITHAHADPAIVRTVRTMIQDIAPQFREVIETKAGCTITAHCGRGTLGILYINKP